MNVIDLMTLFHPELHPHGMSRERFEWLESWVSAPGDVIRFPTGRRTPATA